MTDKTEKKTPRIDEETAKLEFIRWSENCRIEEVTDDDDDEGKARRTARDRIVGAIQKGLFVVDEAGYGKMTCDVDNKPVEVCFNRVYAGLYTAMDKKKDGQHIAKMNAALAALTGRPDTDFVKMHPADQKICQAVVNLFLV
jgi:hypothetical protein